MRKITHRQLEVLQAVDAFRREEGLPPTVRELMDEFGVTYTAIYDHLKPLKKRGLVTGDFRLARTLRLTPAGKAALRNGGRLFEFLPVERCAQCWRVHVQKSGNCQSEVRP